MGGRISWDAGHVTRCEAFIDNRRHGYRGAPMTETALRSISIVVPVLDDAVALARLLDDLDAIDGLTAQRVIVDGGSIDESLAIARARADVAFHAAPGRAVQIGAGIAASDGAWIWMLHADARVSADVW